MNKGEFIEAVATKANISKKDANLAIAAFQDVIIEALKADDKVSLVGFGSFEVVHKAAKSGRNPHTGETINIPAKIAPKFKPGKGLKDALN